MLSVKPASQEQSQDSRHIRHQYGWERQNVQSLRRRSTFLLHMYWRVLLVFIKIPGTRKRTRWKCRQHYDLYNCFWTFSYLLFSWSLEDDCLLPFPPILSSSCLLVLPAVSNVRVRVSLSNIFLSRAIQVCGVPVSSRSTVALWTPALRESIECKISIVERNGWHVSFSFRTCMPFPTHQYESFSKQATHFLLSPQCK